MTSNTFSVYADTPNHRVNTDALEAEIKATSLAMKYNHLGTGGDVLTVFTDSELTEEESAALSVIISAHDGEPSVALPETVILDVLKTTDNRIITKENKRPLLSNGFCTSRGENPSSPATIGGGTDVARYDHVSGDGINSKSTEIFFHVEGNRTWLMDGFIRYVGAKFDEFSFEIRPMVTTITTGLTGTNFRVSGGYLLVPTAGNGTVSVDTNTAFYPCSVTPKTDTGFNSAAYWNLDYNSTTNTYSNLTAAANPNSNGAAGNGKYNIFTADVCLKRYINKWGLLGDGVETFSSTDPSEFGSHLRGVFKFTTIGHADPTQFVDHSWQALVNFTMFREKIA